MRRLSTRRLELIAATVDHLQAELESPVRLAALLHAEIGEGWPPGEYDRGAQEFFRDRLLEGGTSAAGWFGWYAILRGTPDPPPVVVGAAGYFGPPNESGEVEIGFSIMPAWRRQGLAAEIVEALVAHAFTRPEVRRIIAHTTPQNEASCGVLRRVGFRRTGMGAEPGTIRFEFERTIFGG